MSVQVPFNTIGTDNVGEGPRDPVWTRVSSGAVLCDACAEPSAGGAPDEACFSESVATVPTGPEPAARVGGRFGVMSDKLIMANPYL